MVNQIFNYNRDTLDVVTTVELQTIKYALDQLVMMVVVDNEGQIVNVNNYFCKMTKYSLEEVLEQDIRILNSGYHTEKYYRNILEIIIEGESWTGEVCIRDKNGELYWVKANIIPVLDEFGIPYQYLVVLIDITDHKNTEQWKYMAYHDELTDLPNRRMLNLCFNSSILLANQNKSKFAVLFMDIDHFKYINDQYGHLVGERFLKEVGRRLRSLFSSENCIFRLGGDEFIILLNEVESLEEEVHSILDLFFEHFDIDSHKFKASTSIGISLYPDHSIYQDYLMKNADIAMLESKKRSGNSYRMYDSSMRSIVNPLLIY